MRNAARTRSRLHMPQSATRLAAVGSLTVHAVAGLLFVSVPHGTRTVPPPVYRVELVAAPTPVARARRAPETVQRPAEPPPPTPVPPRRTSVAEAPPPPPPPPDPEVEREPAPRATPAEEPLPDVTPSTGADPATVKVEGLAFPYPEYLRNIVAQIYRRWQRPGGNVALRAEVMFLVHRDGSISNLRFVTRSGNFGFDIEAQGAIEAAGTSGAFGPLPPGFESDVLPVSFFFDPQSVR
ncbi:MAG TPA: TonB C-terminal domain-containing protein [Gemmatimonadales bacterium]